MSIELENKKEEKYLITKKRREVIKDEEIRQFVEKGSKKITMKESIKEIQAKIASMFVEILYNLYLTRVKKKEAKHQKGSY